MNKSELFALLLTFLIVLVSWVSAGTIIYLTQKNTAAGIIAVVCIAAAYHLSKWAILDQRPEPQEPQKPEK